MNDISYKIIGFFNINNREEPVCSRVSKKRVAPTSSWKLYTCICYSLLDKSTANKDA
jgi:hypothetical protein